MKSFKNIASLIKKKRLAEDVDLSQQKLSNILGYKNGQFISNVERGICTVPAEKFKLISKTLKISKDELKESLMKDYEDHLDKCLKG